MNVQPNVSAAASVAGTGRAAGKGGESDKQASEAIAQQSKQDAPGGKAAGATQVESGSEAEDRGADGRQMYDQFESTTEEEENSQDPPRDSSPAPIPPGSGSNLDLLA